ncbi:helix-turn-helix transcriptional regulator [Candidatus Saccharibacteria bacterium]|nr:helix-turn-helix transcriptional regulator [Candidatus Saccharibacteria bacterium]
MIGMSRSRDFQVIAKRLKKIRISKGMTQAEVAKKAGISTNHYATIERGETVSAVSLDNFRRILDALEVEFSSVLCF